MSRRALWAIAAGLTAAFLAVPAPAAAGAPNYDCVVGEDGHLVIDQWAGIVAATGFAPGPAAWGSAEDVRQAGPSLDLVATLPTGSWTIAIRAGGRSLVLTRPGGITQTGHCLFVPGSFVLRAADNGGFALRTAPSADGRRLSRVAAGAPVWQTPDPAPRGRWMHVDLLVARASSLQVLRGWLRQRLPLVPRYRR